MNYTGMNAIISTDGLYRYALHRRWAPYGTRAVFIMLNPSTADETTDDPTIRRCVGFARREGCSALTVANLYAWRATKPDDLLTADDPIGYNNHEYIHHYLESNDTTVRVAAWGAWRSGLPAKRRPPQIDVASMGFDLSCLGVTSNGDPRHPLYVRADQPLVPFGAAS
jgi:hypothetical protein